MNASLHPLAEIFRMNTGLLRTSIEGMTDDVIASTSATRIRHANFIVLHIVDARYHLARLLGAHVENPYEQRFGPINRREDIQDLPPFADLLFSWYHVSEIVMQAFERLQTAELSDALSDQYYIDDDSTLGAIAFMAQHESYHIGQLGILRSESGLGNVPWVD